MSVTKKFIIILSIGLAILILTSFTSFSFLIFLVYNVICFGLLVLDFFISPQGGVLEITRPNDDKLYFKTTNTIIINIRNNYVRPIYIEIKDEIPDWHFQIVNENLKGTVLQSTEASFDYDVIPSKRGSFEFKNIYVKYRGILGLCTKYHIIKNSFEFRVYPNLKDLSKYRLILQKNRLLQAGERRIHIQGAGSEFESQREYVEGDDYRKINWITSARHNKLTVNQYEAEKNQPIFILIDSGRAMSYTIRGYKKLDYAINAALILSDIVNQKGDNSGLMVFNTDIKSIIMPSKGENHRNKLMEALYHIQDTKNTPNYEDAFKELLNKQKRRSVVFIFTDFQTSDEAKDLTNSIGLIKRHHIPIVILMKNESLLNITEREDETLVGDIFQKGVALDYLEKRENIIRKLNAKGIPCIESFAEKFALTSVNYYLKIKTERNS